MMKRIFFLLTLSFTFAAQAAPSDEEVCAQLLPDLTKQVIDAHADEVKSIMTTLLMMAYRRYGAPITEDKIIYSAPVSTLNQRQLATEIKAKVDAGPNAILAEGISKLEYRTDFERVNEVDPLGRITGTKLVCTILTTEFSVDVINVTSKQVIDFNDDMGPLEFTIEMP